MRVVWREYRYVIPQYRFDIDVRPNSIRACAVWMGYQSVNGAVLGRGADNLQIDISCDLASYITSVIGLLR